ncbi:HNH endonuclease [Shimia thalassica]|uniref:HNH endonuclease n=1 Tax=Shimia thalassica TaxID=1715693 RepID=UPI002732D286|nr:HNH endonuclease [Shimia thalassica]MDP2519251.1 HNH endonuclease [Shimia thalassica]
MKLTPPNVLMDPSQAWYNDIIANHYDEADKVVQALLDTTETDANGCMVTPTVEPRKVRFRGQQDRAYRFVYCILHRFAATRDQVVRHRCHNRRCVNPDHLIEGSRADNVRDERDRKASGVDYRLL